MILFQQVTPLRRGGDEQKRGVLHALAHVEETGEDNVRWWVSECGRRIEERGPWRSIQQAVGEAPQCRTCRAVLAMSGQPHRGPRSVTVDAAVEAAARIQAQQQGVISRLRFEVLALQEVVANLIRQHTRDGAGYCTDCRQAFPCSTIETLADRSRIWRKETDVAA